MGILHGITVGLFLLLGGLFSRGKAGFLLAGTDAEPSLALCRRVGRLMFLLAGCWSLILLSELLQRGWLHWLGLGAFLLCAIVGAIRLSRKSGRKRRPFPGKDAAFWGQRPPCRKKAAGRSAFFGKRGEKTQPSARAK